MDLKKLSDTPPWEWPEDAGATLLEVLRDPRAAAVDRLLAIELAGDLVVIDDEIAAELLAVVRNAADSDELRGDAAIALGPILEYADEEGFEDAELPISERTFQEIQGSFQELFREAGVPKDVRRRVLEAAVRAPQPWHADAVRDAYASGDASWAVTAAFCMRYVRGFEQQILDALGSESPEVRYEAVCAAGAWAVEAAWPSVASLLAPATPKPLLLAAIEAAVFVAPEEAPRRLRPLLASLDDEVVDAVHEALAMAEGLSEDEEEEEEEEEEEHKGTWH